jgi:hypothetical protein
MKTALSLLLAIFGIGLTALFGTTEAAPLNQECRGAPTLIEDFETLIELDEELMDDEDWEFTLEFEENEFVVTANWLPDELETSAIIIVDILQYDCGYEDADLEDYYSEDNFEIILEVYEDYELVDECEQDGIILYEYDLVYEGEDYVSRFWINPVSDTRVQDVHITFVADDDDLLDDYSELFFPDFPEC